MKCCNVEVVFQEIPREISLAFSCTGCPNHCPDCHSKFLWNPDLGVDFTENYLLENLMKYKGCISCVLFYGGEWEHDWLLKSLKIVKSCGMKTALYTGLKNVPDDIKSELDYLKVGPFIKERGSLRERTTNQRLYDMKTGEDITYRFWNK